MSDLIKALQIFLKYGNPKYPTHCEHDILMICGIDPKTVSNKDRIKLHNLGFCVNNDEYNEYGEPHFYSYKYGSA